MLYVMHICGNTKEDKMNKRIEELAEQAGGFVDLNQHVGGEKGCMIYTYDGLEKFAQLIVQECASVAVQGDEPDLSGNPHMDLNGAYMAGKGSASLMIQEHFQIDGFEE